MDALLLFFLLPVISLAVCLPSFGLYRRYVREREFQKETIKLREERLERQRKLNSLLEKRKRREEVLRKKRP